MKNAIISGANGFIGSKLAAVLIEHGVKVCCLVQQGTSFDNLSTLDVDIIEFDLLHIDEIEDKVPHQIDAFYHMAWAGVSTTYKNEYDTQMQNIQYSLSAIRTANKIECEKFICPGSVSEYAYTKMPVTENSQPNPSDVYSAAKVATHYICDIYAKQTGQGFIWTVISSVYGPGREDNNLITYAIKQLLNKKKPSFTKLEQIWDYLYIDDLINGLYLVGCKGVSGNIYPIGSGIARPMAEYAEIIKNKIDPTLPLGIGDIAYKNDKIDNSVVDISLLQRHTGFQPQYSFEEGISRTIEYFKLK